MTTLSPIFRISPLAQLNVAMGPVRRVSAATDGACRCRGKRQRRGTPVRGEPKGRRVRESITADERALVGVATGAAGAEGSASGEAHPCEENHRADESGRV
jgi:hypothetical protein